LTDCFRVALAGFTKFERNSLSYCFRHSQNREPAYQWVDGLADFDFVVADGNSPKVVERLRLYGHMGCAVLVGAGVSSRALTAVPRPINPLKILDALDRLVALREGQQQGAPGLSCEPNDPAGREEARAATRRARRQAMRPRNDADGSANAVLVMDGEASDRDQLCGLLAVFGFLPVPVQSVSEAVALLNGHAFAAAFLVLATESPEFASGAELCQRLKQVDSTGRGALAVVVVTGSKKPSDRTRATLLGGDTVLVKPLGRGEVARSLESCGVHFPADPRRS